MSEKLSKVEVVKRLRRTEEGLARLLEGLPAFSELERGTPEGAAVMIAQGDLSRALRSVAGQADVLLQPLRPRLNGPKDRPRRCARAPRPVKAEVADVRILPSGDLEYLVEAGGRLVVVVRGKGGDTTATLTNDFRRCGPAGREAARGAALSAVASRFSEGGESATGPTARV